MCIERHSSRQAEGREWSGGDGSGVEGRGGQGRAGQGRAGQGRVPDGLGGLSRVGISSRSTRPWNGQPPSCFIKQYIHNIIVIVWSYITVYYLSKCHMIVTG